MPPIRPPWVFEGTLALDDPKLEEPHWVWGGAQGVVLASGDALLLGPAARKAAVRDGQTGHWRIVPGLPADRFSGELIALRDGSALVVGGTNAAGISYSSVYRFDPSDATWARLGVLEWARSWSAVALLPDNRVLVAGGSYLNGQLGGLPAVVASYTGPTEDGLRLSDVDVPEPVAVPYASVEIFDPATGLSTPARSLSCARRFATPAALADGRIMIVGLGEVRSCSPAEVYDPRSGSFTPTGPLPDLDTAALARQGVQVDDAGWGSMSVQGVTPLADGGALIRVGYSGKHEANIYRAFRYRPATNSWAQFGPTGAIESDLQPVQDGIHSTTGYSLLGADIVPLRDGRLFVIGGSVPKTTPGQGTWWVPVLSTRTFDPARNHWADGADVPGLGQISAPLRLHDGSVLLAVRFGDFNSYSEAPLTAIRYTFDPE